MASNRSGTQSLKTGNQGRIAATRSMKRGSQAANSTKPDSSHIPDDKEKNGYQDVNGDGTQRNQIINEGQSLIQQAMCQQVDRNRKDTTSQSVRDQHTENGVTVSQQQTLDSLKGQSSGAGEQRMRGENNAEGTCKGNSKGHDNGKDTAGEKLDAMTIRLLVLSEFAKDVKSAHPSVKMKINENDIIFDGEERDVESVKALMKKRIKDFQRRELDAPDIALYLESEKAEHLLEDVFHSNDIHAVFYTKGAVVNVYAIDETQLDKAVNTLMSTISHLKVPLDTYSAHAAHGSKWDRFAHAIEDECSVQVIMDDKLGEPVLIVVGFKDYLEYAVTEVRNYLETGEVVDYLIETRPAQLRYVLEVKSDELTKITEQGFSFIETIDNGRKCGILIHATRMKMEQTVKQIEQLLGDIRHKTHHIDSPDMSMVFMDNQKEYIKQVEKGTNCRIDVTVSGLTSAHHGNQRHRRGRPKAKAVIVASTHVRDGRNIAVAVGDITGMTVDAIVNAANDTLQHGGGLAKAIVDAGGSIIQDESNQLRRQFGKVRDGQVVSTGAGRLLCRRVIHAVGPRWNVNYKLAEKQREFEISKTKNLLADAVQNSLIEAEKYQCKSIAIPAISAGIFGFPLDLCADVILRSIDKFCKTNPPKHLHSIYLVDNSEDTCFYFQKSLIETIGIDTAKAKPQVEVTKQEVTSESDEDQHQFHQQATNVTDDNSMVCTAEGKMIMLVEGSLANQETDVIVNTIGVGLDLKQAGPVSKAILQQGGAKIQQELDHHRPGFGTITKEGQLIMTSGGALKCKAIYHSLCSSWEGYDCIAEQHLKRIVTGSLHNANKTKMESISFPAIGTGRLGFPVQRVASIMLQQAVAFSKNNPGSTVKDVKFVVYGGDYEAIEAFREAFSKPVQHIQDRNITTSRSICHGDGIRTNRGGESSAKFYKEVPGNQFSTDVNYHMTMGKVRVEIVQGDITKETTDVIVNCTGYHLGYKGGVSRAIVTAGGEKVKQELKGKTKPQKLGSVIITSPGNLKCKHILHLVTDPDNIKDSIHNVLKRADKLSMNSLAVPTIGTGVLGYDPQEMAKQVFKSIEASPTLKTVSLVRIVIYEPTLVQDYQKAMEDFCSPSFRKSITRGLKHMFLDGADMTPVLYKAEGGQTTQHLRDGRQCTYKKTVYLDIYSESDESIDMAIQMTNHFLDENCFKKVGASDKNDQLGIKGTHSGMSRIDLANVSWFYCGDSDQFEEYDRKIAGKIETAYQEMKDDVVFEIRKHIYQVCFRSMTEKDRFDGTEVKVKREYREGAFPIPEDWNQLDTDNEVKLVNLQVSSNTYKQIEEAFLKTIAPRVAQIVKIERVQNIQLYNRYMSNKQKIERKTVHSGAITERVLYHGSSTQDNLEITTNGFRRILEPKHDMAFGKGCYFSVDSNTAADGNACPPDSNGNKCMYQCMVLTGEYTAGKSDMIVPPAIVPNNPTLCYDSVVDDTNAPTIFVVFGEALAYPKYLITFKEDDKTSLSSMQFI
ncbi:protein mono-ADP-ribosyltransferase PARP14-like [Glandiceps talaboti]